MLEKNNKKIVSIIIPTYNGEKYIVQTIMSCLSQTYNNIEIIVVDDFSTDSTKQKVEEYFSKLENITLLVNDKNIGFTASCNRGWSSSIGDYLIFLGHDDLLPVNHVEKIVNEFCEDTAFIHCNSKLIDEQGNFLRYGREDLAQMLKSKEPLRHLSRECFIQSCGLLINRKHFELINGWDETYRNFGEWLNYIRLLKHGCAKYTTASFGIYRRHKTNITNTFCLRKNIYPLLRYHNHCRVKSFFSSEITISNTIGFIFYLLKRNAIFIVERLF